MNKFENLLALSPLVYIIHHAEEHIIFNFREWREKYFLDNNFLSTEEMLMRLIGVFLIIFFIHLVTKNRPSALIALFFLMGSQVVNVIFHTFFSFYYNEFSPGAITALLLYLPLNYFIIKAAFNEGFLKDKMEVILIFFLGCTTFTLFEIFGPFVLAISTLFCAFYYVYSAYIMKAR
tara:strand:+ start:1962 stop:2492 length:531 start_codon:yes stop_codon:yes gene_type:complete